MGGLSSPATATDFADFQTGIINTLAPWAQSVALDEFSIGNEEELHIDGTTLTDATLQSGLRSLATTLKAGIYTAGDICYHTAAEPAFVSEWQSGGLGDIDLLGWNCYFSPSLAPFVAGVNNVINSFAANEIYLTEWNVPGGINAFGGAPAGEAAWAQAISDRLTYLKTTTLQRASFFCYRGVGQPRPFGVYDFDSNTPYRLTAQALGLTLP
jgi:hypothetical protein